MKNFAMMSALCLCVASVALAGPPGPIDGLDIPANYAAATPGLVATQTNHTQYGDYSYEFGSLTSGTEADAIYLGRSGIGHLTIGLTGNLETNGHAWMICIDVPGRTGQQAELRAEGVDGPPYTLQTASREIVINDNGTPEDDTDDTWMYGSGAESSGTVLPIDTDYVLAVNTFGGTAYVNKYDLSPVSGGAVGTGDPTPGNTMDTDADVYATQTYIGSVGIPGSTTLGQYYLGFINDNVLGVTDTDASAPTSATTGMEIWVPFTEIGNLGGDEIIQVYVLTMDGSGATGVVVNQSLPGLGSSSICDPPGVAGLRPDLSSTGLDQQVISFDLNTSGFFGSGDNTVDGNVDPDDYTGGAAEAAQTCPTPYGDQIVDEMGISRGGGSELDELFVDTDGRSAYFGLTGNLEENGNKLAIYLDTDPNVGFSTLSVTSDGVNGFGSPPGEGLEGDSMPPQDDGTTLVKYDHVLVINTDGNVVYVDLFDLVNQAGTYLGFSNFESGNGDLAFGSDEFGVKVALNNTNRYGVLGCGGEIPGCGSDSAATVAGTYASSATATTPVTTGFEIELPIAALGLSPCDMQTFSAWATITSNGGSRSNQSLPSIRGDDASTKPFMGNPGTTVTDWYDPMGPLPEEAFEAVAVTFSHTPAIVADCNSNGMEDHCEVLNGDVPDTNFNGIPDGCEGACCSIFGGCYLAPDEESCDGIFYGAGSECSTTDCPAIGACCNGTVCSIQFETECAGSFQGEGTLCSPDAPDPCAPTGGACCTPTGCVDVDDAAECDALGYVCDQIALGGAGCLGDADLSGVVNASDRGFVSANIGITPADIGGLFVDAQAYYDALCSSDIDCSGVVNASDRGFVSANIGLCTTLPPCQDGSGLDSAGSGPDTRFVGSSTYQGDGTDCGTTSCP